MSSWFLALALGAPLPDVDAPLRTGASAPSDAAVVVGVEDYAFLADVPGASRDARAWYHWLVYSRGVPAERVTLLSGGNREQILDAVARARASLGPGGTLWITWAGHGATSPDDGGPLLVGDDAKADPRVFLARSVALTELGADAVVLLDTCWAGKSRDGVELVPGTRFAVPVWADAPPAGGARVTAAQPSQLSERYAAADHGLFSYFFVGALRGWADGELDGAPDGKVTLREAHAFTSRAIATVHPTGQVPTFEGADRVLVEAPGRLEPAPDLATLPKMGQKAPLLAGPGPLLPATAPLLRSGKSWSGELTLGDDKVLTASDGSRHSLLDAARATQHDPAVVASLSRYRAAETQQLGGVSLLGTSAITAGLTAWTLSASESANTTLLATYGLTSLGTAGLGAAMIAVGGHRKARERPRLVQAINGAP